ncbi:hypothetical protein ACFL0Q_02420 [Thermodesulfobacteriota bacterium]
MTFHDAPRNDRNWGSEGAIFSLHRYFVWANQMRVHFDDVLFESPNGGEPGHIGTFLYMSYWYAGLYVVVEGWRELELSDAVLDGLLECPNVDLLRRYRNGVFHYKREYFDKRFMEFMNAGEQIVTWCRELNSQFGRFFLQWYQEQEKSTDAI